MRILLVTQYFWPENFRINDLARALVERGHNVTVLTGYPNYPAGRIFNEFKSDPTAFGSYFGATVRRVPMFARGSGGVRLVLNYLSFVVGACVFAPFRLFGQRFDIVFVFEPSPVTVGLPAILLGRIKQAPVVFWVQDLWPETLVAVGAVRSKIVLAAVGSVVRFIYDRCALVLGQSVGFLDSIAQYCTDARKVRYFPNWTDDEASPIDGSLVLDVPAQDDSFDILFAGNVGVAQDFPAILDAAESLKANRSIRWLIVGDGRMSDWLRHEVARRGLAQQVFLLGRFPPEAMPSFYAQADALLVSLKRDPVFALTIPSKVQSYLMAGIPLLGMLDGEGAAVIRNADAGRACAAGDSTGLAKAALELSAMPETERQRMGSNGRAFAEKEFGRKILLDRLETWFAELVQKRQIDQSEPTRK
jgi:colanic acid biosynthesis glycosyl transferase WcaI